MPISFHSADTPFNLPRSIGKLAIKRFIQQQVLSVANCQVRWNYIFCSDEYLLEINRKFLRHDYYTDIITFPLLHVEPTGSKISSKPGLIEAEIYISVDRVRDNAVRLKEPFEQELLRVIFHGALHLIGYQDKTKPQRLKMRQMEELWMVKFGLSLK